MTEKTSFLRRVPRLFTNFTEWNCEIRLGSGVDPILFHPKTLAWRVPTMFMVGEDPSRFSP